MSLKNWSGQNFFKFVFKRWLHLLHPEAPLLFELYLYLYPLTYFCAGSLYHFIIKENFFDPVSFFIFLFSTIILSFFSLFFKPKNVVAVCSYFSILEFMFSLYFFPYFFKIVPIFGFQNLDINFFFFDVFSYSLLVLTLFVYILLFFFYRFSLSLKNIKSFLFILLFSKYILVFIFLTTKIFYFFIFFETILLPFFFLISLWGSNLNRIWSAQRLLFFTLFFSTPFFYFILQHINFAASTFFDFSNFFFLTEFSINFFSMFIFFVSVFLFLGVKIPLFPMHIWLPEAHGEAPTIGSILLASLLLKLGAYGLYRFFYFINTFNYFFEDFFFFVYFLAIFSMVSSTLAIFVQLDFKKAIAYFSISHMSYVVIGFITGLYEGILGSYIITLSHGLSSALLFFLVGFLYDQTHTRSIFFYSQLASKIPRFSFFFFFICLANISFPGSAGFVGEQLIFFALSFYGFEFLLFPILFTIFSGFATILFLLKLLYGTKLNNFALKDLKGREYFFSVYCLFPIFFFGFFPFFLI